MSEDTAGPVGQAVELAQGPSRLLEALEPEFGKILPARIGAERFTRWALTVLRKPELIRARVLETDAGRLSVMAALMDCASLGLEPGRTYHLVPFGGKDAEGRQLPKTVTGIVDYKGEIELITNAQRCTVVAQLVREKDLPDHFAMTGANVPPRHDPDWFADRGEIAGGYAYADFGDGLYSLVVRMTEADFRKHREVAKTKEVWDAWPEPMRLKTLVHQLRKWVPWSAARQRW